MARGNDHVARSRGLRYDSRRSPIETQNPPCGRLCVSSDRRESAPHGALLAPVLRAASARSPPGSCAPRRLRALSRASLRAFRRIRGAGPSVRLPSVAYRNTKPAFRRALCFERPTGVEPASRAWEARIIPLYDGRKIKKTSRYATLSTALRRGSPSGGTGLRLVHVDGLKIGRQPSVAGKMAGHCRPLDKNIRR